ncbi:GNAT family N-acetyltransferase [Kushneria pakistanensis]|nr:GNAT family N-acetyltransferase [Kushneria pakistanensis]
MEDDQGMTGAIYWQGSHIVGLLVDPRARGRGLGRALMAAALARMEKTVTLDVVASNAPAIRLYESLRFQGVGQREGFYQGVPVMLLRMKREPNDHA